LLWHARHSGARLIDASSVVVAVHQNHDYSYHPDGEKGVWQGEEAKYNEQFLQGGRFATLDNATHVLSENEERRNYRHWLVQARRRSRAALQAAVFKFYDLTRTVRHWLGLRRREMKERTAEKN